MHKWIEDITSSLFRRPRTNQLNGFALPVEMWRKSCKLGQPLANSMMRRGPCVLTFSAISYLRMTMIIFMNKLTWMGLMLKTQIAEFERTRRFTSYQVWNYAHNKCLRIIHLMIAPFLLHAERTPNINGKTPTWCWKFSLLYLSSKVVIAAEFTITCTCLEISSDTIFSIPRPSVEMVPLTAVSFLFINSS